MSDYEARNPARKATNQRRHLVKKRYGLTLEAAEALVVASGGLCAICRREAEPNIDHCHASGRVRGVLCRACNKGLGHFYDKPDLLRAAAAYLERHADNA